MGKGALVLALSLLLAAPAEAQRCLHDADESQADQTRREGASRVLREINLAQTRFARERGNYVPLAEATNVTRIPLGFAVRLTFDQWGYAVIAKDILDPCGFALFSDQNAVVYAGRPTSQSQAPSSSDRAVELDQ
jgi:hypothetical protein